MRVNKYLALCGLGSRRHVEALVTAGRVSLNGTVITDLATIINPDDTVTVDHRPVRPSQQLVYIMLNKPDGYVTTTTDPQGRPTVLDLIYQNPKQYGALLNSVRLYPVGRLDYHTTGLLLLTNDGELTKQLTHPRQQTNKVYLATVDRPVTKAEREKLSAGVRLDGVRTAPAQFEICHHDATQLRITLHEGRNRQIRRMFAVFHINVVRLTRIQEGQLRLGNLPVGDWKLVRKAQITGNSSNQHVLTNHK